MWWFLMIFMTLVVAGAIFASAILVVKALAQLEGRLSAMSALFYQSSSSLLSLLSIHLPELVEKIRIPGPSGYTPQVGKDFFTPEQILVFKEQIRPRFGVDYQNGEKGDKGDKGDAADPAKTVFVHLRAGYPGVPEESNLVLIRRHGEPYIKVPRGSKEHLEALKPDNDLTVEDTSGGESNS
jgi:hypothetical protein